MIDDVLLNEFRLRVIIFTLWYKLKSIFVNLVQLSKASLEIVETETGIIILVRLSLKLKVESSIIGVFVGHQSKYLKLHLENAAVPILVTVFGIVILLRAEQLKNDCGPILVTDAIFVIVDNDVHESNVLWLMNLVPVGHQSKILNPQLWKAFVSIFVIYAVFVILVSAKHPLKALDPILDNEVVKIKSIPVNEVVTLKKALGAIEVTENNNVAVEIPEPAYVTLVRLVLSRSE